MRAHSPSVRSGQKKKGGRPYSATVHYDPEGNGPTSAAARHKCRAGKLFQLRTGTSQFIRQEGERDLVMFRKEFGKVNVTSLVERVSRFSVILKNRIANPNP